MAKQPETKVKFSIFNKEFNEGIDEMNRESTTLRKEFKLQEEQLKQNGSASDLLTNRISRLSAEHEITRRKIQATEEQLAKAKTYYGENSNEANILSNRLLDLQISEQKIENAIGQTREELSKQSQAMQNAEKDAKGLSEALGKVSEKSKDVGGKLSTGVSLPLAGIGVAAGKTAVDIDGAVRLMTGSLGATGDEAKQLEEDLRTIWSDGFGDNPEAAARAMAMVKQNIKGVNEGKPLQEVTKDALTLANVTDSDVSEVTRGVNQLMHNFGLTSKEAMDLFAKGQAEGLNYSQEMFDNISEYSPLFKQMGFSADEYFTILANGTQNGAYNLDYINALMQEFDIKARDGSDTTADAFEKMSKSTQEVFEKFKDGKATTDDLFNAVIPELEKMDDQILANQIGVDLFGTKFEDMGAKTVYSLDDVNTSLDNTKGSMDALGKSQEESFGTKLQSTLRKVQTALEPIGIILLNMLLQVTPYLQRFAQWFQNLSPTIQKVVVVIGGLLALIGPLITVFGFFIQGLMPIISVITKLWGWLSKLGPVFNAIRVALLAINPVFAIIAIAVAALAILIYKNWDTIKAKTIQIWEAIKKWFSNFWTTTKKVFSDSIKWLTTTISNKWNEIKQTTSNRWNAIKGFFSSLWNGIKSIFNTVISWLLNFVISRWNNLKSNTLTIFNAIKSILSSIWNGIKSTIQSVVNGVKNVVSRVWYSIRSTTSSVLNGVKSVVSIVWNRIKSTISGVVYGIRSSVSNVWNGIKSSASSAFNSIRSTASSVWNRIKNSITSPIRSAKSTLTGIIGDIKGAFSRMRISIPKPKLPHVSISTAYKSLAGISIPYPKFNIRWYKTGGVMTEPFTMGNAGFGDVEEGIVPFEGKHAMKIAKLIAAAQNKLNNVSNGLVDKAIDNLVQVNVEAGDVIMDNRKVGSVVWRPVQENIEREKFRRKR